MGWKVLTGVIVGVILIAVTSILIFGGPESEDYDEGVKIRGNNSIVESRNLNKSSLNISSNESIDKREVLVTSDIYYEFNETSEKISLSAPGEYINLGEKIVDHVGEYLFEEDLNYFLRRDFFKDHNNEKIEYWQKMGLSPDLILNEFVDDDYMFDENVTGFNLSSGTLILNYSVYFVNQLFWEDLEGLSFVFFGRDYFIINADPYSEGVEALENPYFITLNNSEKIFVHYPGFNETSFSIDYLTEDKFTLVINGKPVKGMEVGEVYAFEGVYIYVEGLFYSESSEKGFVELVISPMKNIFSDGWAFRYNSEEDKTLTSFLSSSNGPAIDQMGISWIVDSKTFASSLDSLVMPYYSATITVGEKTYDDDSEEYADVYLEVKGKKLVEI